MVTMVVQRVAGMVVSWVAMRVVAELVAAAWTVAIVAMVAGLKVAVMVESTAACQAAGREG